jgi:tetratricopeptide (TPR) repeat protein
MKKTKHLFVWVIPALVFLLSACNNEKTASVVMTTDIPVTSKSEEAKTSFQQGLVLFDDNNPTKARSMFTKAIELDPNLAVAYMYRANVAQSPKDFMDDMSKAKDHLEGASDWEKMYYDYQNTFVTNDWNKRLEVAQKIVTAYPDAARAQVDLGNTYLGGEKIAEARAAFQKAIDLNPKWLGGYAALGGSYVFNEPKDFKKGEENALKTVELAPKSSNAQIGLGDVYRAQDDLEKARTAYAKAVELNPDEPVAYYKKGHVNSFLGKYDEARNDYMEGAKHDEDNLGAMMNIAFTYLYAGDHKMAMQTLMDNAAKQDASGASKSKIAINKINYLTACALACFHYGDVAHLKETVAMMRGASDQIATDIGSQEEKLLQKANMLYWAGMADAAEGNMEAANAKVLEMQKTLEPINIPTKMQDANMLMGVIAMKEKKYDDAIGNFEKANQNSVYTKYWLAMAQEAAGHKDKAQELLKEVSVYNFNGIDYAVIRNEVKKKLATP